MKLNFTWHKSGLYFLNHRYIARLFTNLLSPWMLSHGLMHAFFLLILCHVFLLLFLLQHCTDLENQHIEHTYGNSDFLKDHGPDMFCSGCLLPKRDLLHGSSQKKFDQIFDFSILLSCRKTRTKKISFSFNFIIG